MASVTVRKVENAKPEQYIDEGSLMLFVKPSRGKSWVLRAQVDGWRRDIGLASQSRYDTLHGITTMIGIFKPGYSIALRAWLRSQRGISGRCPIASHVVQAAWRQSPG
jgi:hypothetical protein